MLPEANSPCSLGVFSKSPLPLTVLTCSHNSHSCFHMEGTFPYYKFQAPGWGPALRSLLPSAPLHLAKNCVQTTSIPPDV